MQIKKEFLPVGSVVIMKGTAQKVVIIQRAITVDDQGAEKYFDYGAVDYPEGLVGMGVMYFNQDNIFKVVYEGYCDEDEKVFTDQLNQAFELYNSTPHDSDRKDSEIAAESADIVAEDDDPFASVRDMEEDN
jgi:hypothetical protein